MDYLESAVAVIGFLLAAAGAEYYRRLYRVTCRLEELEEKMTAYELAQALNGRELETLTSEVRRTNDTVLPSLNKLDRTVAVLADRLEVHMNGGNDEDA